MSRYQAEIERFCQQIQRYGAARGLAGVLVVGEGDQREVAAGIAAGLGGEVVDIGEVADDQEDGEGARARALPGLGREPEAQIAAMNGRRDWMMSRRYVVIAVVSLAELRQLRAHAPDWMSVVGWTERLPWRPRLEVDAAAARAALRAWRQRREGRHDLGWAVRGEGEEDRARYLEARYLLPQCRPEGGPARGVRTAAEGWIAGQRRALLLGGEGSGKTRLLERLAARSEDLAVYVDLGAWALTGSEQGIDGFTIDALLREGLEAGHVIGAAGGGEGLCWLLDDLEVGDLWGTLDAIDALSERYPAARIVVAAREAPAGWGAGWEVATLDPWTDEEIVTFLTRQGRPDLAARIGSAALPAWCRTSSMLVAAAADPSGRLPARRVEAQSMLLQALLRRWRRVGGMPEAWTAQGAARLLGRAGRLSRRRGSGGWLDQGGIEAAERQEEPKERRARRLEPLLRWLSEVLGLLEEAEQGWRLNHELMQVLIDVFESE